MVTIVDYGMGNLGSIRNMLLRIGAESTITSDPADVRSAEKLILPGVGAFDRAMQNLEERGLVGPLNERVLRDGVPILGICLGMQLFCRGSEEGVRPGLGWIEADSVRFANDGPTPLKLPHMGWNTVSVRGEPPIFRDRFDDTRFYFVHTYHVRCADDRNVYATTTYGTEFHSSVGRDNIVGTQFHPEKSHRFGLKLLRNFVENY
ncbi:MAG: imidazole glycerol phosphate synthase subunit HisH [Fimbriimonadaceae bacterium]|nr:imidazole glycerol phosphate synthase subunit HisH [Fimbriimonadaceae bacterium]